MTTTMAWLGDPAYYMNNGCTSSFMNNNSVTSIATWTVPQHAHTITVSGPVTSGSTVQWVAAGDMVGGDGWVTAPQIVQHTPKEEPKLSIAELQRKLADMLGQVEAQEKARPVLQAIDAMHGYRKSDGRPFTHYDPLLKE